MVVEKLPSPLDLKSERVERLLCPRDRDFNTLPTEIKQLKQGVYLGQCYYWGIVALQFHRSYIML